MTARSSSMRSIRAMQRLKRNRNPGTRPDYLSKLDDSSLAWLASFEQARNGYRSALELTPEQKAAFGSERYRADEAINNSSRLIFSDQIELVAEGLEEEGHELLPWARGKAKEAP